MFSNLFEMKTHLFNLFSRMALTCKVKVDNFQIVCSSVISKCT